MSEIAGAPEPASLADLLAAAYQIEADAVERYELLAAQMEAHNNPELVKVFRDMARAEGVHRDEILRLAGDLDIVAHARQTARWTKGESPEEADLGQARHMMTPQQALDLVLAAEKRAFAFFSSVATAAREPGVKKMAEELAEEEAEHVNLVYRLIQKYSAPDHAPLEDLDPPIAQG